MNAIRLYRQLTVLGAPAIAAYLALRRMRGKEDRARFDERMGITARPRPPGALVWLHAASVGEAQSALSLIDRILKRSPSAHILVTTGTVTSATLLAARLPERAFHQFVPVDRPAWVARFLDHWRPDLALWIESELWPNLVTETSARHIPMVLVNARMSDRSFANWQRAVGIVRPLISRFDLILAQSDADAARYRALGGTSVLSTGSLKYDAELLPVDERELGRLHAALDARPRWIAASTHPGEEIAVAEAHQRLKVRVPDLITILAPRHPGRGDEISAFLTERGLRVARRSRAEPPAPETDIYLADTMGELGLFFRLSPIVFMGGSLVPHGGQNLIEPARFGAAIVVGPHVRNFRAIASDLEKAGAAEIAPDAKGLARAIGALLDDDALRARRGAAAKQASEAGRGALDRVMRELEPALAQLSHDVAEHVEGGSVARP